MARSPVDDIASAVKDAAYVSVGLGVMAFQRLQVRRNELSKALSGQGGETRGGLDAIVAAIGEHLKVVEERFGAAAERR